MAEVRRAFVVGHPINHSRSPLIHRYWLDQHGIAGSYEAHDIAPYDFPVFLAGLCKSGWVGGNITIPHKETAFASIERRDEAAEAIGAVNTVWIENDQLAASNTDAFGFAASLDAQTPIWRDGERVLIIGAGGASRAVLHALIAAGYKRIDLANRTLDRAQSLRDRFGSSVHPLPLADIAGPATDADLIVNTTSLGMKDQPELALDFGRVRNTAIAADIVYAPLMTPFLKAAQEHGLATADGLGMLLHQAVPGFERWFGVRPEVTAELRALIVADLEQERVA